MVVAAIASLAAALLYAVASVLQHRAATSVAAEHSMRLGLLARLVTKPWWLAGIAADAGGFVAQFIALGNGPLILVQPLLVTGLLFALPLGAWVSGGRIRPTEMRAAALVVVGLILLLLVGNPSHGHTHPTAAGWVALTAATAVPVGVLIVVALRSQARPALLAASAGVIYGYTAALAKVAAHALDKGILHTLGTWQLWALIPAGVVGMVICQSAFQAGPLKASLPTLTAIDPVVSIVIGVVAFHERIDSRPVPLISAIIGTAVMVVGILLLGTSPLVALEGPEDGAEDAETQERSAHGADRA